MTGNSPADGVRGLPPSRFAVRRLESRTTRWRQGAAVGGGFAGLWLISVIARWSSEPSSLRVVVSVTCLVLVVLVVMGAAIARFLESIEHARTRIFRFGHLVVMGSLYASIATLLSLRVVLRDPFSDVLSKGRITANEVVDLGDLVGAALCLVGAIAAFIGARDAYVDERPWRH